MPVSFRILSPRGLVFVRYHDHATIAETEQALDAFGSDPRARPGLSHLIDLAAITGFEHDFVGLMGMQARKASLFVDGDHASLVVYHAPKRIAREMAAPIRKSWEGLDSISVRILETEQACLDVLGQPERSFAALLQAADTS